MIDRFERFSYAIFEITRCWHKLAAQEVEKYGLRGTYAIYLLALQRCQGGITAARLCELCGRDKADVSRALSQMEQKGLVKKEGSNYRAQLKLTEAGEQAATHVRCLTNVAVEYAGKGFSPAHREIFYSVLETITANLQDMSKEGLPQL